MTTAADTATVVADADAVTGKRLARVALRVRWRDLDAFEHVNNASFLTFLEEARLAWLDSLGDGWQGEAFKPVLAATHLNYRRQLTWPNEVAVELHVERLGTTSLTLAHRIVGTDDAMPLYLDGNVVMVWIDPATGSPVPLPAVIRNACV